MPAPLNANERRLATPAMPATAPLRERIPLTLAVACASIQGQTGMDAVVQPYQFDPESDPEGEAPEEVQTLRLQQDFSEWLVCLNNVSLLYVLLQLLPCTSCHLLLTVKVTSSSSATVNTIKTWQHLPVARVQLLSPIWLGLILL